MRSPDSRVLVAGAIGVPVLVLGFVFALSGTADDAPPPSAESALSAEPAPVASLEARLADEVQARERLQTEVAALRDQFWAIQLAWLQQSRARRAEAPESAEEARPRLGAAKPQPRRESTQRMFDVPALVESGVSRREAADLRARWEELVLGKLEVSDRAAREGWAGTARHEHELRALEDQLRSSFGDQEYDAYLFASDSPNQVIVQDIAANSAAAHAGMRTGDTILRYDGARVFETRELQAASRAGQRGEPVSVEVLRGGEVVRLTVPRGPFGAFVTNESKPPVEGSP